MQMESHLRCVVSSNKAKSADGFKLVYLNILNNIDDGDTSRKGYAISKYKIYIANSSDRSREVICIAGDTKVPLMMCDVIIRQT